MSKVEVIELVKRFGPIVPVDNISFTAEEGQLTTLLGPSGCGKTTTLRMIAGLEVPNAGEIRLGDETVTSPALGINVPAERRNIGMVFQSYAIWPHMTAFENVAYQLRMRGLARAEIDRQVSSVFELLRLKDLERRYPGQLSGGQQQRVALARALVYKPKVLLLDEPLANLDAKVREVVRFELKELQKRLGFTAIYVTHDQNEAMALSDKIIVMDQGKIVQEGTPSDIYERPATRFVAEFVGQSNLLFGRVRHRNDGSWAIELANDYVLSLPPDANLPTGPEICICVRPEDLQIARESESQGGLRGVISTKAYLGNLSLYRISCGSTQLQVQIDPASDPRCNDGEEVVVRIRDQRMRILA